MLNDLLFSLDKVMPFFLLILLGYFFKRKKLLPDAFFGSLNTFVYRFALPLNLFSTVASAQGGFALGGRFTLYSVILIPATFALLWLVTELLFREKKIIGTLVQGGFRGNFALLGVPLASAVVGEAAAVPAATAMATVIPVYNCLAVFVLVARGSDAGKISPKKIIKGIIMSPLIIGVLAGIFVSLLRIPMPDILTDTVNYVGGTATPLGLISIGGLFNLKDATSRLRPSLYASAIKLVIMPFIAVSLCYALGFRGAELFLFYIIFGAPVAVSTFSMATEHGGDGPLASNILIVTTLLSSVTLSCGIFIMRSLGWI